MSKHVFAPGNRWLIGYLAFLSAFAPLSTDLFLPALPSMAEAFHTTAAISSLIISCFLLIFALSMLFWGPLSDKYGRKPILVIGAALYVVSSVGIVWSGTVGQLIGWRCVQAVGSGAVSAMSLAIVKDVLRGRVMEKVVTFIQTITILAPMLAPVVGGVVLLFTDWRGIFWCLTACGLLALAGTLALSETLAKPVQTSLWGALGRIPVVLQHRQFTALLLIFSATCMPFMAYVAVSAYVFQSYFGLSAQAYSYFFALNAAASLAGPLLHERFFRHGSQVLVLGTYLLLTCLSGVLLMTFGSSSAVIFAVLCLPMSFCTSALRPPSTILLMQQIRSDNGTVTALINSSALLFGSLGMFVCALSFWENSIIAQGAIACLVGLVTLVAWLAMNRQKMQVTAEVV